jgi:ATP-dependent exoDNAse (exonuclease V) alpha subunit
VLSLDYSYAVTGHSAQGLDASRVVLEKDTHSRTTHRRSFYTDLTRARDTAVVVTDSTAGLAKRVRSDLPKVVALDVVGSAGLALASAHELSKE